MTSDCENVNGTLFTVGGNADWRFLKKLNIDLPYVVAF